MCFLLLLFEMTHFNDSRVSLAVGDALDVPASRMIDMKSAILNLGVDQQHVPVGAGEVEFQGNKPSFPPPAAAVFFPHPPVATVFFPPPLDACV
jgi:hypothetical protein